MNDRDIKGIGMTSQRTRDRLVERLREKGVKDPRVLETLSTVPRHLFVDEAMASRAYEDTALPIGEAQTISQPYVVARMTEALIRDGIPAKVLEIGTGSGYQAAVLSRLVGKVITIERIRRLCDKASERFRRLNYLNIETHYADGEHGWAKAAPYDGILVTAAPEEPPPQLLQQLAEGGVMIIPIGKQGGAQQLLRIVRRGDDYQREVLDLVSFVPFLTGKT